MSSVICRPYSTHGPSQTWTTGGAVRAILVNSNSKSARHSMLPPRKLMRRLTKSLLSDCGLATTLTRGVILRFRKTRGSSASLTSTKASASMIPSLNSRAPQANITTIQNRKNTKNHLLKWGQTPTEILSMMAEHQQRTFQVVQNSKKRQKHRFESYE